MKLKILLILSIFTLFSFTGISQDTTNIPSGGNEIIETNTSIEQQSFNYNTQNQQLEYNYQGTHKTFPAWLSILPPLIAIILALIFKEVHVALLSGIFVGIFTLKGFEFKRLFESLFEIADTYFIKAIAYTNESGELQTGHLSILLFSIMIGGMVHIISSNGGMNGVVEKVSKLATNAKRTQLATMLMGCLIFFDDYANSLVVGNTMRPLTDKFKISREKLAYIVDSTAAPVAAIAFVTTWIGYQLSEIERGVLNQTWVPVQESAYGLFLGSLKYAFYPIFTLFFMLIIILLGKDFGPMLKAEQNAQLHNHQFEKAHHDKISHWLNAALPVLTLVITVIIGLYITGKTGEETGSLTEKLRTILGNADSYTALIWASFFACLVAIVVSLLTKASGVKESMESLIEGFKSMIPAVVILVLAWALAGVIEELHTASYLASLVPKNFNAFWLPTIFFLLSAVISFATGSSWNTMAVMYPICIPIVLKVVSHNGADQALDHYMPVLLNTISVVLAASVFGDHCSPISDTTILSSLSSKCDHISHVNTQLPYAIFIGLVSLLCGGILFALHIPWFVLYAIGFIVIYLFVHFYAKKSHT